MMDVREQVNRADHEIDLGEYFEIFRKLWWKVVLLSLAVGVITIFVTFQMPDVYQTTAVITPASEEGKQTPALSALATLGIVTGTPSKVEDLETLFKSKDLTVRVFKKYDLWSVVFPKRFDRATGKLKVPWAARLFSSDSQPSLPGYWDAVRVAKESLKVEVNKRAGTVSVSFESPTAESSSIIVRYYLDEGKSRLQEEALERAGKNKKFIEDQISKTVDPLTRDRLYAMYGQEVEREMLARNREQFGFKEIDGPMAPDRKASPSRGKAALFATLLSLPLWGLVLAVLGDRKKSPSQARVD